MSRAAEDVLMLIGYVISFALPPVGLVFSIRAGRRGESKISRIFLLIAIAGLLYWILSLAVMYRDYSLIYRASY